MVLQINDKALLGLGNTPPKIGDTRTNNIANPNTTLEVDGSKKNRELSWTCNDWVIFHQTILKWFLEGRFQSRIKYPTDEAQKLTNQVWRQHWDRASWTLTRCGYTSDFVAYFQSVGLGEIFNLAQRAKAGVVDTASKVASSGAKTLVNVVDNGGNIVSNVTGTLSNVAGVGKYFVPVVGIGIVSLVGFYLYKNYVKGNARVEAYGVKV